MNAAYAIVNPRPATSIILDCMCVSVSVSHDITSLLTRLNLGFTAMTRDTEFLLSFLGFRLRRDKVQPTCSGEIKSIADHSRTCKKRSIHLNFRKQFLSPSGMKNGHEASSVPNVKPVA